MPTVQSLTPSAVASPTFWKSTAFFTRLVLPSAAVRFRWLQPSPESSTAMPTPRAVHARVAAAAVAAQVHCAHDVLQRAGRTGGQPIRRDALHVPARGDRRHFVGRKHDRQRRHRHVPQIDRAALCQHIGTQRDEVRVGAVGDDEGLDVAPAVDVLGPADLGRRRRRHYLLQVGGDLARRRGAYPCKRGAAEATRQDQNRERTAHSRSQPASWCEESKANDRLHAGRSFGLACEKPSTRLGRTPIRGLTVPHILVSNYLGSPVHAGQADEGLFRCYSSSAKRIRSCWKTSLQIRLRQARRELEDRMQTGWRQSVAARCRGRSAIVSS